ncbi:MAG: VWA domain-containing protein [Planctomycetota bacterium]|nr:VWA domain-containing protein [Planctomycetota bacterium]
MFEVHNTSAFILLLLVPILIFVGARTYDNVRAGRKWLMVLLRNGIALALIVDFLTLHVWWTDGRKLCVYYLVDLSTSMEPYRSDLARTVSDALKTKSSKSWAGVIVFDSKPRVVVPAGPNPDVELAVKAIEGESAGIARSASAAEQGTNIEDAIRLAISSFPGDHAKRICLISDCNETAGDALQQAAFAKAAGVDIVSLIPQIKLRSDLAVDQISIPGRVHLNQAFEVRVSVTSSFDATDATEKKTSVQLFRNNYLAGHHPLEVKRGSQILKFRQNLPRGGRFVYEARVVTDLDQSKENDRAYTYLELKDVPRVLVLANERAEQKVMRRALKSTRMAVEFRPSSGVPQSMLDLEDFSTVILGNIPAKELSLNQMKLLHDYVQEFGGTLIACGGDKALSAGGYAGTPLEAVLPARFSFTESESATSALVLVVDNSVSMRIHKEDFKGEKTLFVQRFLGRAVDVFSDRDFMGVVGLASESTSPAWLLTVQHVVGKERMKKTEVEYEQHSHLYRSLSAAYARLKDVNATNKGIIVITDGYLQPGPDYPRIAMQLASGEVSISCVSVGRAANHKLLSQIARYGNGRYYAAEKLEQADQLLEREVQEFARAVVIERPVDVLNLKDSEIFRGIDIDLCPTLFGYVRVNPKLAAETLLMFQQTRDPLLLSWNYGAGRAMVFATDVSGKWSQLWAGEWANQSARLWQNLVGDHTRDPQGVHYTPRVLTDGWGLHFEVDGVDPENRFVDDKPPKAGLYFLGEKGQIFSEESRIDIPMRLGGPGLYKAQHRVDRSGVYLFKVAREDGTGVQTTGAVVSVSKELASLLPNASLQKQISTITGGIVTADTDKVFTHIGSGRRRPYEMGPYLLLAACLFLALNIAARRWPAAVKFLRR